MQIGERDGFVTRRAKSTRANPSAEASALLAILLPEIAGFTDWAPIDGAWPRGSWRDRRKRSRVAAPPRCLAAGCRAKALSANPTKRMPTHGAGYRRSAIVTPPDLRLHDQPPVPGSVAPPPCQTWPEPIGRYPQMSGRRGRDVGADRPSRSPASSASARRNRPDARSS